MASFSLCRFSLCSCFAFCRQSSSFCCLALDIWRSFFSFLQHIRLNFIRWKIFPGNYSLASCQDVMHNHLSWAVMSLVSTWMGGHQSNLGVLCTAGWLNPSYALLYSSTPTLPYLSRLGCVHIKHQWTTGIYPSMVLLSTAECFNSLQRWTSWKLCHRAFNYIITWTQIS